MRTCVFPSDVKDLAHSYEGPSHARSVYVCGGTAVGGFISRCCMC